MATAIHQYEDKLLDFAYGELPAPEASAVESHVKSCPRCTQALAQIKGVRTHMAALPQVAAPDAGLESLLAYAEQAAARNAAGPKPGVAPWWRRIVAPLAGACALALVVVVAIQTDKEGGLDVSKESAMKAAKLEQVEARRAEERPAPAPVVAAAPEPAENAPELAKNKGDEGAQFAANEKAAKAQKTVQVDRAKAKADRAWDTAGKQNALVNNDNYAQEMGATPAPKDAERQQAQRDELGEALAQSKESKSRREMDYGNARGGYVQEKVAAKEAKEEEAMLDAKKAPAKPKPEPKQVATKDSAPPPPQAQPAPPPPAPTTAAAPPKEPPRPAEVAQAESAEDKPMPNQQAKKPQAPSSLGLSMGGSSGPSAGGSMGTGSSSAYRSSSNSGLSGTRAPSADDDTAARGVDQLAERKRMNDDVDGEQRRLEAEARPHLEAARAASMQSNHQEEVKQSLYVLQTGVKGAARAEALSRMCNALLELGNEGQADQYCNALIREFPNSAAAKIVSNRRKEMQRMAPAPTAKKSAPRESYDEADKAEAAPAKAKKAADQAKPTSAY